MHKKIWKSNLPKHIKQNIEKSYLNHYSFNVDVIYGYDNDVLSNIMILQNNNENQNVKQ